MILTFNSCLTATDINTLPLPISPIMMAAVVLQWGSLGYKADMLLVHQLVSALGILMPREMPPPAETAEQPAALKIEPTNPS